MAEIRLDLCHFTLDQIKKIFRSHNNLIATFRRNEGIEEKFRIGYLKAAIDAGAKFIDLDFESNGRRFISLFRNYTNKKNCKLIISIHDYHKTPDPETIDNKIQKISKIKPDFIKLAFTANTLEDNDITMSIYKKYNKMIAFNMGEKGKITRAQCLKSGALFTYISSENESTAAGQMTISEILQYSQ